MINDSPHDHTLAPNSGFPAQDGEAAVLDLRQLLLSLWHHKLIIICVTLIALGLAHIYISQARPLFESAAKIRINLDRVNINRINARPLFKGSNVSAKALNSEIAVLQSRSHMKKLARHMGLYSIRDMKNFSMQDLPEISTGDDLNQFKTLDLTPRRQENGTNQSDKPSDAVIGRLGGNLEIRIVRGTVVLEISYKSPNPDLAAAVPQALAELFIKQTLTTKLKTSNLLRKWLKQRMEVLSKKLQKEEQKITEFRNNNEFFIDVADKNSILLKRLIKINGQIIGTSSKLARKKLKVKKARSILKTNTTQSEAAASLQGEHIQSLRKQERNLLNKKAEAFTRYGPKHPRIKAIKAEIRSVREEIPDAVQNYMSRLENDMELLAKELEDRKKQFQKFERQFKNKKAALSRLRELKRNANNTQQIHDSFLDKYKRTINNQELEQPEAELIARATKPNTPLYPKKNLIYALSGIVGVAAGTMIVIAILLFRTGYYSLSELERDGLDTLGIVPKLKRREKRKGEAHLLNTDTKTPIAEALHNITMTLRLRSLHRDAPISVLAITSTYSGEGKTSTAGWLAQTIAHSGLSVCVVDADLRKPGLHRFFQLDAETTLVDYLGDHAELDDIIQHSTTPGLDVITSRSAPAGVTDLLGGDRIKQLIDTLRQRYDFVIFDTPALLAVPDAGFITLHADHIAYIVDWRDTSRDMLARGLKVLKNMPGDHISAILSRVDVKHQARQGHSDMMYYYST